SGGAGAEAGEVLVESRHPAEHLAGVVEDEASCGGQSRRPGATRALEEPLADDPLEGADPLGDGRLGVTEVIGGGGERPAVGHRHECVEMAEIQAVEMHGYKHKGC